MTILPAWSVLEGGPSSWHKADETSEKTRDPNKLTGILQNRLGFVSQTVIGFILQLPGVEVAITGHDVGARCTIDVPWID